MPWLGYFDKIASVDHFVLLDTVQFKKNEWQNRNRIKSAQGSQWLTVPVSYQFPEKINQVTLQNKIAWQKKQQKTLQTNYGKAPFYDRIIESLDRVFTDSWETIADLNCYVVKELAQLLGITTPIHRASEMGEFPEGADQRIIAITRHFNSNTYLAGHGGKAYMDIETFRQAGITVRFQHYNHPVYPQLYGAFIPFLSLLDLVFNCGPKSLAVLRGEI